MCILYIMCKFLSTLHITTAAPVCRHENDESWLVYAIESSTISALLYVIVGSYWWNLWNFVRWLHLWMIWRRLGMLHVTSSVWGSQPSTEYFTLWLTKSHHFSTTQTSLKQLGMLLMLHCIFWLEIERVYSRMMQQILPTGRHCAHYNFFCIVYCIVL